MNKNRKVFKISIVIVLLFFLFVLLNNLLNNFLISDIETIKNNYEQEKQKIELLQKIPEEVIEEGIGINLHKVPEEIRYRITNNDDSNITFYCYIKEDVSSKNPYTLTIELSNNYEILEQTCSNELIEFEEYKKNIGIFERFFSALIAVFLTFLIFLFIIAIIRKIKKSDSKQN